MNLQTTLSTATCIVPQARISHPQASPTAYVREYERSALLKEGILLKNLAVSLPLNNTNFVQKFSFVFHDSSVYRLV